MAIGINIAVSTLLAPKCFVVSAVTFSKEGIGTAQMIQEKLYGNVRPI
ncbi:MAG: hypothetical protein P4L69_24330 [Desulfosporosinus sp.]|nr:hypothetical protein [Desulfosporosinus sp.]